MSGKITSKIGARKVLSIGLISAATADILLYFFGTNLFMLIIGVTLLGLGFIFTHSTLLTRATTFAEKARGSAMSLVAFCFMGGGGLGTAIGGKVITLYGINTLFAIYGSLLLLTLLLSYAIIKDI
jgi:predicted MFS family arabinose efflux permease